MTITASQTDYWSIDGTPLHTLGWNVSTLGGGRVDLPTRRGNNLSVAYLPGNMHRDKLPEARIITLAMWMIGVDPSTGAVSSNTALQWNDNWDTLRRLVWKPNGAQVTLTKRWYQTIDGVKTLLTAHALAEILESMSPDMTDRAGATFTMSFLLATPFFFGDTVTVDLVKNVTQSIDNPGHDVALHHMEIDLIGPLTNPRLTNVTPTPDVWIQLTGTIDTGQTVNLSIETFAAISTNGANRLGDISHSGARHWFGLLPGANGVTLTASAGTGSAQLRFRAPYI